MALNDLINKAHELQDASIDMDNLIEVFVRAKQSYDEANGELEDKKTEVNAFLEELESMIADIKADAEKDNDDHDDGTH